MYVCNENTCTACGACINLCPQSCIRYVTNNLDVCSAFINEIKCINCGLCKKVCPQLHKFKGILANKCYASWSKDQKLRTQCASGGVASTIYQYALENNIESYGVRIDERFHANFFSINSLNDLYSVRNSKYVWSDAESVYLPIKKVLMRGKKAIFIGLPCQVDGIKNFLDCSNICTDNLFCVDIICHGTCPPSYLRQHIDYINYKRKSKADKIYFRDPSYGTSSYTLSLYSDDKEFYKMKVHRKDLYQIGYHYSINLRENCYECKYSRKERSGDITIGDFSGFGSIERTAYNNENVSCILINSPKGEILFECIKDKLNNDIRPVEEAFYYESRFNGSAKVPKERTVFVNEYQQHKNYEHSMYLATRKIVARNEIRYFLHLNEIYGFIRENVPECIKKIIKQVKIR